ncbi:hypothetical protein D1007_12342 [Hordeum vulgare]|nr:hypothetical protein D1007_12342 [Hordeum vulgare]
MKVVMELSKKMRLDISAAAAEPAIPSDISAVRDVKNKPAGKVSSGGKNHVPKIGQDTGDKVPLKPSHARRSPRRPISLPQPVSCPASRASAPSSWYAVPLDGLAATAAQPSSHNFTNPSSFSSSRGGPMLHMHPWTAVYLVGTPSQFGNEAITTELLLD